MPDFHISLPVCVSFISTLSSACTCSMSDLANFDFFTSPFINSICFSNNFLSCSICFSVNGLLSMSSDILFEDVTKPLPKSSPSSFDLVSGELSFEVSSSPPLFSSEVFTASSSLSFCSV